MRVAVSEGGQEVRILGRLYLNAQKEAQKCVRRGEIRYTYKEGNGVTYYLLSEHYGVGIINLC